MLGALRFCALAGAKARHSHIPRADVILREQIGAGTEKRVWRADWRGERVAALEILGASRTRDLAWQEWVREHPTLGAHAGIVRVLGVTEDGLALNELALGSLTNYDGSPAVLTSSLGDGLNPFDVAEQEFGICKLLHLVEACCFDVMHFCLNGKAAFRIQQRMLIKPKLISTHPLNLPQKNFSKAFLSQPRAT